MEVRAGNVRDQAADNEGLLDIRRPRRAVHWQSAADPSRESIPKPGRLVGATRVARAALLPVPVRFALDPVFVLFSVEKDVEYEESAGEIVKDGARWRTRLTGRPCSGHA